MVLVLFCTSPEVAAAAPSPSNASFDPFWMCEPLASCTWLTWFLLLLPLYSSLIPPSVIQNLVENSPTLFSHTSFLELPVLGLRWLLEKKILWQATGLGRFLEVKIILGISCCVLEHLIELWSLESRSVAAARFQRICFSFSSSIEIVILVP